MSARVHGPPETRDIGVMSCQEESEPAIVAQSSESVKTSYDVTRRIVRLQLMTLGWMLVECVLALLSAWRAHSPVLLVFGADSLIELLSALVVLLQFVSWTALSRARAARLAGFLLFALAAVVTMSSSLALWHRVQPDTSWVGIGVTVAALVVMPALSSAKRRAAKISGNRALTSDAIQSATCAYLAGITLAGLALNALLHVRWVDPVAALVAVPIICIEAKEAFEGETCC